jgi:hypothetical protein
MAIDACQPQVERALQKDGWTIIASPKHLVFGDKDYFIDLELERTVGDESDTMQRITVEVKCLSIDSKRDELYTALGQYMMYTEVLLATKVSTPLYLAIADVTYQALADLVLQQALTRISAKIVLIDFDREEVKAWKTF